MEKISTAQLAEVMSAVGPTLRKLAAERDEALAKLAARDRRFDAEKVASAMIQKGLSSEPFERVADQLEKAAEQGNLDKIRDAVDLSGPDMGEKIARMNTGETLSDPSVASAHDFVRFIVGDVG